MDTTTLLLGVVMFIIVMVALVAIVLTAKKFLVSSADVKLIIEVDGIEKENITTPAGSTLLNTLSVNKIFIPSACGGKGTCGVCKVDVLEGGGEMLPTERSHITKAEARHGCRLACQVKVKADIKIDLEAAFLDIAKWECTVISNNNVATFIKEFKIGLPEGESVPFRAGGYIQIECPPHIATYKDFVIDEDYRADWDTFGMWGFVSDVKSDVTRAYSMANYPEEYGIILLNIRIASPPFDRAKGAWMEVPPGIMSSYIFAQKPGDKVVISGPYGEFFARDTDNEMVFVGGGAGMAPMRSHIFDQFRRIQTKRKVTFWYGARSFKEAFYLDDFDSIQKENHNFEWHVAMSDARAAEAEGWQDAASESRQSLGCKKGYIGFIHNILREEYLNDHPAPEDCEYYLCGPPMMNTSVITMLEDLGVERDNIMLDDFGG